jgi:hypothetical protein
MVSTANVAKCDSCHTPLPGARRDAADRIRFREPIFDKLGNQIFADMKKQASHAIFTRQHPAAIQNEMLENCTMDGQWTVNGRSMDGQNGRSPFNTILL